jgi:hypothetical protein
VRPADAALLLDPLERLEALECGALGLSGLDLADERFGQAASGPGIVRILTERAGAFRRPLQDLLPGCEVAFA